jgi:hypothetical protein
LLKEALQQISDLKNEVVSQSSTTAKETANVLLSRFSINGVVPLTIEDINRSNLLMQTQLAVLLGQHKAEIISEVQERYKEVPKKNLTAADEADTTWYKQFQWNDGKLSHPVPINWEFPSKLSVKAVWDMWFFGDKSTGIRPLKFLNREHDLCGSCNSAVKKRYSAAKLVIEELCKIIKSPESSIRMPAGKTKIHELTVAESEQCFSEAYKLFIENIEAPASKRERDINGRIKWVLSENSVRVIRQERDISYATAYEALTLAKNKLSKKTRQKRNTDI